MLRQWLPQVEGSKDSATQITKHRIAVLNLTSDLKSDAKFLPSRADIFTDIAFTPDGKSVAYVVGENGVGNIWSQPLDGAPGHMLSNFTSDAISSFRFSPDGKSLAVARSHVVSDVMLLRESASVPASPAGYLVRQPIPSGDNEVMIARPGNLPPSMR